MLISATRPLAANNQAGVTLVELMMAIGIAGSLTLMVSGFLVGAGQIQKTVLLRAEVESLRSITLRKVDCSLPCGGLTVGSKDFGPWTLTTECHQVFQDGKVTFQHKKIAEAKGALFSLDSWVCKARRPKQCLYACHNSGIMLDKGYVYPSLDSAYVRSTGDLQCPSGEMIGIDFSTNRIICDKLTNNFPTGPMCKQDYALEVGPDEPHQVAISGRRACIEHSQDQVRLAMLSGLLKIDLDETFKPSPTDKFVIIIAEKILGRFRNPGSVVTQGKFSFQIKYEANKVYLTGFKKTDR